jgi:predicted nuclease with TOPRIM domain
MPNPTKEQLKQKVKDLKERVSQLDGDLETMNALRFEDKHRIEMLEDNCIQLKEQLDNKSEDFQSKAIRMQLHGGTVKELL